MNEENAPAPADNAQTPPAPAPAASPPAPAAPTASWRDSLPEDVKNTPTLGKFETIEGLAKSYVNLEKMLGSDKIVIPKEGDTEGWGRTYKALGQPDKPEDYGFKQPEKVADGLVYNAELDQQIAGIFHKSGLNKAQAATVREGLMEIVGKGALDSIEAGKQEEARRQADIQKGEQALKQEWGQAYEQRGKMAGAAINKFLSPETVAALDAAGLANNPAIIKDMYKLGVAMVGEKELIGSENAEMSTLDLDKAIADHTAKYAAALFDKSHPEHDVRAREREALFKKRYPEAA